MLLTLPRRAPAATSRRFVVYEGNTKVPCEVRRCEIDTCNDVVAGARTTQCCQIFACERVKGAGMRPFSLYSTKNAYRNNAMLQNTVKTAPARSARDTLLRATVRFCRLAAAALLML